MVRGDSNRGSGGRGRKHARARIRGPRRAHGQRARGRVARDRGAGRHGHGRRPSREGLQTRLLHRRRVRHGTLLR